MIGVGGLVEMGSTTAAWLVPLIALSSSVGVRRITQLRQPYPWRFATQPCVKLLVAWLYFPLAVEAVIAERHEGQRDHNPSRSNYLGIQNVSLMSG
jgi:hypothetical protein